jgi:coproporphyrinogen III oxidase-like Fe-S oxidoreductase
MMIEALYLGLRQADGIDLDKFEHDFHIDFRLYFHTALDRFEAENWLTLDDRRCRLTVEGMLFLDRIVDELVELIEA